MNDFFFYSFPLTNLQVCRECYATKDVASGDTTMLRLIETETTTSIPVFSNANIRTAVDAQRCMSTIKGDTFK